MTDQDTENLKRIQRGIRASKKPGATMSVYQESRIRHFHKTLEAYMAKGRANIPSTGDPTCQIPQTCQA